MKCSISGLECSAEFVCVPVGEDAKSLYEPCQSLGCLGPDDCGEGAFCAFDGYDTDTLGTCLPACQLDEGLFCADPDEQCMLYSAAAAVAVCGRKCDVLVQDCPDGMGCVRVNVADGYYSTCLALVDPAGVAEVCHGWTDCQAGLACANGVPGCGGSCCTPYCAPDDPAGCDAVPGAVCMPLAEEFGVCVEP